MKKLLAVIFFMGICSVASAQNPKIDRLEMLFAQGHYKKVHRKANRLLDDPEYDFSLLPSYYKSISLIQLSQNRYWLIHHPNALENAYQLFMELRKDSDSKKIFESHMYELSWLKRDMTSWAEDYNRTGLDEEFQQLRQMIDNMFENLDLEDGVEPNEVISIDSTIVVTDHKDLREEIVETAQKQLGVPYTWAGNSPDGFDCSGFTSYVMQQNGKDLPRRAADQYEQSIKVKSKNVQQGDLVFFDNGSGVSHVGIVVSGKGEPLVMIHSSSSKGIIVTNVSESEYWKKRLYGFGTYVSK